MRYVYNKLVRDKIPENISSSGRKCNYKILNDKDYLQELDNKLFEEAHEFVEEHSVEELADLIEVVSAIMKCRNISLDDVNRARQFKNSKNGSFNDRVFLVDVEQNTANERESIELKKDWRKNPRK